MKRFTTSLFTIMAVLALGIFATGAYFTDTSSANNYTFTTGSADLKFGFCPGGIGADCSGVPATMDSHTFTSSQMTGPGMTGEGCLVVENTGDYGLNLTSFQDVTVAAPDGMQDAFLVYMQTANAWCDPATGSVVYNWQSARAAENAGNVAVGSLAPGARMYIIQRNAWDSAGNQSGLQNGTLKINTSLTGQTV